MEQILNRMKKREEYLLQIKSDKENALKNSPEGTLRIAGGDESPEYYHRKHTKDVNGNYISANNLFLAKQLAQKSYDKKVLNSAELELEVLRKYFLTYPEVCVEQIYDTLHRKRQKLVEPIVKPLEQYIQNWENFEYKGKVFTEEDPEFYSAKGERVRSKSEVIIADLLHKEGIPYRYECPIYLNGVGWRYPDFTILNVRKRKEIYWEHLGMMDDPVYAERAVRRIADLEKNGIYPGENLILTFETRKVPINQKLLKILVERYLK